MQAKDAKADRGRSYRHWQIRTLAASMAGYAAYYLVRKNLSIAMPAMQEDLHLTKADLGLFLTLHGLLYGLSKFANGFLGDRIDARLFMAAGLVLSAAANLIFGLSSAVLVLGVVWMANGWVQGMGFPPCARLLTHWFPPRRLATVMSLWNTSHSIGSALALIGCGYLVAFGWRWCFFVPAGLAILISIGLLLLLPDTPGSVGFGEQPNEEAGTRGHPGEGFGPFVRRKIFGNGHLWILALANFFVYAVRYGILDWGPTILKEWKGIPLSQGGWMVAAFELSGVAGMLAAGWATDRFFEGKAARVCALCMAGATTALVLFWRLPPSTGWLAAPLLSAGGFFIYGPQALIGIAAANLATRRAAATAVGFTGIFGYLSTVLSGWGLGRLVDARGWNFAFGTLVASALGGLVLLLCAWRAPAHGYQDERSDRSA